MLVDNLSKQPVLYTENLFVAFGAEASNRACRRVIRDFGLTVKHEREQQPNTFFVGAKENTGLDVFGIAEDLLKNPLVELCHPELIRERRTRGAYKAQWHLKTTTINGKSVKASANVVDAWKLATGKGVVIAVIDDGVDIDHQDFKPKSKIVAPRDVGKDSHDPRPVDDAIPMLGIAGDAHGTACAGVACANGKHLAAGVAPSARLMPIRLANGLGLGSDAEAQSFLWAADNGADVISCSWGPPDGDWSDPTDPVHKQITLLPDSTRTAMEYAVTKGRKGKGCVIVWAAGNGNEKVDNDGYASSPMVIAVAACNDRGKKSAYSDFGKAVWCAFPSSDFGPPDPLTPGIWTTDRSEKGEGYNPHFSNGDAAGLYTDSFGGTSSACPGVAGVAALILDRNPSLTWSEVKEVIKKSCDQIDKSGGKYSSTTGKSRKYGYGRVNASKAVKNATPTS